MKENDYIIIINWQMRNMNVQFNISNKQELAQKILLFKEYLKDKPLFSIKRDTMSSCNWCGFLNNKNISF